jgi:hypothetical protein
MSGFVLKTGCDIKEQAYKEIDELRAELGHPKTYEKLN